MKDNKENNISFLEKIWNSSKEELQKAMLPVAMSNIESKFKNAYGSSVREIADLENSVLEGFKSLKDNYKNYDVNTPAEALFKIEGLKEQQRQLKQLYKLLMGKELQVTEFDGVKSLFDSI